MMGRPTCKQCNKNPCKKGNNKGKPYFYSICSACAKKKWGRGKKQKGPRSYRKNKGPLCEFCGFIPVDSCQLDVDHKDGNHKNHDPTNLQTLCANCHRLKSKLHKEGIHNKPL